MENMVRKYRKAARISQASLAEKTGTTEPEIQRIEAGAHRVREYVAQSIAAALDKPLDKVFPRRMPLAENTTTRLDNALRKIDNQPLRRFQTSDIEYGLVLRFASDHELCVPLQQSERYRFSHSLAHDSVFPFILLDAYDHIVALNPRHITRAQILNESGETAFPSAYYTFGNTATPISEDGLTIFLASESAPRVIAVEPDEPGSFEEVEQPVRGLLFDLETGERETPFITITDLDGEIEIINVDEIEAVVLHRMWADGKYEIWNDDETSGGPHLKPVEA